jgi:hypothetical protein
VFANVRAFRTLRASNSSTLSAVGIILARLYRCHISMTYWRLGVCAEDLQIVPHLTNAIQDWIERVAKIPVDDTDEEPDLCIIEVCLNSLCFIHSYAAVSGFLLFPRSF